MTQQILLKQIERPRNPKAEDDICWFFDSLGIENGRDINHIAMRIILYLLENLSETRGIPVEQIASGLEISSPMVNHHIRNLIDTGIIYRQRKKIYIRGSSLRSMVQEIRKDSLRILDDLEQTAKELDGNFRISDR
jgi:predicted transcriptional regulator